MTVRLSTLPSFGIIIVSIAYVIEITTFPLILGSLSAALDLSHSQALWLVSGYKIALVVSLVAGGRLGDQFGREKIFAVGTLLFSLSSLALLAISDPDLALILRIVQGLGAGLFSPMIPALLAARDPKKSVAALSKWGMITGIAAAVYPFIAALLTQNAGWQMGWLVIPALSTIALLGLPTPRDVIAATPSKSAALNPPDLGLSSISFRVWLVLAYVFLNYGLTTWFIYALASPSDGVHALADVGLAMFVLWSIFALGNLIVGRINRYISMSALLCIGTILNAIGISVLCFGQGAFSPCLIAAALIGSGMALNNVPSTDLAFRLSPQALHGCIASLDIIAARLGGAAFVLALPLAVSLEGYQIANLALCIGLLSIVIVLFARHKREGFRLPAE